MIYLLYNIQLQIFQMFFVRKQLARLCIIIVVRTSVEQTMDYELDNIPCLVSLSSE